MLIFSDLHYICYTILQSHPGRDFYKNEQEVSEILLECMGPPIVKIHSKNKMLSNMKDTHNLILDLF